MPDLICPCQPVPPVSQGFHPPSHNGIDLAVPNGTEVLSPADGVISWWHDKNDNDAGIHINIDHDNGYQTREFHLQSIVAVLGQRVVQGELVAYSNNTGASTGPHVHYEVRLPHDNPLDPAPFLLPWTPPPPPVPPLPPSLEGLNMASVSTITYENGTEIAAGPPLADGSVKIFSFIQTQGWTSKIVSGPNSKREPNCTPEKARTDVGPPQLVKDYLGVVGLTQVFAATTDGGLISAAFTPGGAWKSEKVG